MHRFETLRKAIDSHLGGGALACNEAADDGESQRVAAADTRQAFRLLCCRPLCARLKTQQRNRIVLQKAVQSQLQRSSQAAAKRTAAGHQEQHAPPLQLQKEILKLLRLRVQGSGCFSLMLTRQQSL
jgi:hypothetical protein